MLQHIKTAVWHIRYRGYTFRCYAYARSSRTWYALCVDLNVAAEALTAPSVKTSLKQAVESYIDTVFDTSSPDTIPALLTRQSSWMSRLTYHVMYAMTGGGDKD